MTCATSRANGSIPVLGSQQPNRRAWWTVPRSQIGQRAAALVFELHERWAAWRRRDGLMPTRERLQLRLLIGADDVLAGVQQPVFEAAFIEVQDAAGLALEVGIARE